MFDPRQMMTQAIMGRLTQNPMVQQVLQMKQRDIFQHTAPPFRSCSSCRA